MEQRSNVVALRIATTMPRKEDFVRDITRRESMQLITHRTEQSPIFLPSCLANQLMTMQMRRRNLIHGFGSLMLMLVWHFKKQ
jgi:hypothetical protein